MIAKRDYYNKLFNKYSKNLKMTWKAINDTLNRHKTKNKFPETFKVRSVPEKLFSLIIEIGGQKYVQSCIFTR